MSSYDKYKLSNPQDEGWYSDLVTSCCGSEEESRMINDEIVSICVTCCQPYPDMIEDYEYEERQRDNANEFNRDDL